MKITALLDALNSALAEPFALAWVSVVKFVFVTEEQESILIAR